MQKYTDSDLDRFSSFIAAKKLKQKNQFFSFIHSSLNLFKNALISTKSTFRSRLHLKNINLTFIQNHRSKLKNYAATNCIAESAVSGVKHQMKLHAKSAFSENNQLMLFKRNHGIQRLIQKDDKFAENVSREIFNGKSLNAQNTEIVQSRKNQKIKTFQDAMNESMDIKKKKQQKERKKEKKKESLQHIQYQSNYTEFKFFYDNLPKKTQKTNFLKQILQKLKVDGHTRSYRTTNDDKKVDDGIMMDQIKKLCLENGIWQELESMDVDINDNHNNNQTQQIQQEQENIIQIPRNHARITRNTRKSFFN